MANSQNFTISFIIRANRIKGEQAPIFARITIDGRRTEFSVKRFTNLQAWSKEAGRIKPGYKESKEINLYLDKVRKRLLEIYSTVLLAGKTVTGQAIKDQYFGINEEALKTTDELFDYHNRIYKSILAPGTYNHYLTTQSYFRDFLKAKKLSQCIALNTIDYRMLVDFDYYLRKKNGRDITASLSNNTAMKHFCRIRKMLILAEKLEWINANPFKTFRLSYEKRERGYLSQEQLSTITSKEFSIHRLNLIKDLFVFSCFTGISYIDLHNLTNDNLIRGIDGQLWLSFCRHKTNTPVKLPLLPQAEMVLTKYACHPGLKGTSRLFPAMSNQKMNAYLKEVADLCGINLNLTFHLARHTFATTVTLSNGVPIETVSKILGHNSIKTTEIYAKVIESKVADDMLNLKNRLINSISPQLRDAK